VVADPGGTMLVYTTYGSLTVDAHDVLFRMQPSSTATGVSEVYILGAAMDRAVATFTRAIPQADPDATTFSLLVPGRVISVHDCADAPVAYQSEDAGPVTRLVVRYSDVPKGSGCIYVTAQVDDVLTRAADGSMGFRQSYTLDQDARMRVVVKYPADWEVKTVSPPPATRADGLLVWDQLLRRQLTCAPSVTFHEAKDEGGG